MDKLDGASDNAYEVDTSFSTVKKKRPVDTNEEQVSPIMMTHHSLLYVLICP